MRLPPAFAAFTAAALALAATPSEANAADDELPSGNEAPRVVPTGIGDVYYAWHDVPPPDRQATALSTAARHNEVSVNLASIGVKLEHAKLSGTVILQVGDSVDRIYGDHRLRYVQQANAGWRAGMFHLEAGVMPSLVGRESFLSTENWNYTHAFIADATPYYVAGMRVTGRFTPTLSVGATVFNGWQTYRGNTASPNGQLFVSWKPSDSFSLDGSALVGPTHPNGDIIRLFADLVAAWQLHPKLEVALEAWGSREQGFTSIRRNGNGTRDDVDDPWSYGGVLFARFRFTDTVWFAGRAEGLSDESGVITGTGDRPRDPITGLVLGAVGQKLVGGTITLGWQPHPKLIGRVEALQRYSSEAFFAGETHGLRQRSTTFVVSAAVGF